MNKIEFPAQDALLDANVLRRFQTTWESLQSLASLGGANRNYILSGCTGSVIIQPGVVVIDGEVLPFVGGAASAYIIIDEVRTEVVSGGASLTEVDRVVRFGSGYGQIPWSDISKNRFAQPYFSFRSLIYAGLTGTKGSVLHANISSLIPQTKNLSDVRRIDVFLKIPPLPNLYPTDNPVFRQLNASQVLWYRDNSNNPIVEYVLGLPMPHPIDEIWFDIYYI